MTIRHVFLTLALLLHLSLAAAQQASTAADVDRLRALAEQGDALAQLSLGLMYEFGRGVTLDLARAHKWFNLAAARMPASDREIAVSGRDRVAERLKAAHLAEAQRLAREWRPAP